MSDPLLLAIADARQRFMDLVAEVRPELHRYCARMTGSVFDGEDVVQDTLAKAYFALGQMEEAPPLRPWLFRIAHNTAMDFLRRYEHRNVDVVAEVPDATDTDEPGADPSLVEAALALFASLPPLQRSALALKDVLGHSLEEVAATMDTTVAAVKAALVRARGNIAAARPPAPAALRAEDRERLQRYADLFNARSWDALGVQFAAEARLDVVSRTSRRARAPLPTTLRRDHRGRGSARRACCRRRPSGHRDLPSRVEPHARVLRAGALARGPDRAHPRLPLRPLHHRRRTFHALSLGGARARARVHAGAPARSSTRPPSRPPRFCAASRSLRAKGLAASFRSARSSSCQQGRSEDGTSRKAAVVTGVSSGVGKVTVQALIAGGDPNEAVLVLVY